MRGGILPKLSILCPWVIKDNEMRYWDGRELQATAMFPKLYLALSVVSVVTARTSTVYNACPLIIWPAVFTDLNVGSAVPQVTTEWYSFF